MNNFLELSNVTKSYGYGINAVDQLSISLPKGKIIGLLGPNGSGKTTLIKMINGILRPTSGEIRLSGDIIGPETKARISYLPDRTYLTPGDNINAVLDYFEDFYADFSRETAMKMLEDLRIDPRAKMKTLSKGNKEKVQLILVMSRRAELYVLDEPIAGVDPAARDYILRTILNNYHQDASILISTHLISDIEQILDEVLFMRQGKLILYSSAAAIREQQGKSVDAYFREVFAC
ncbi:MAG: ABC transporter ATP-binding protein [Lachnospiraceae bacterium]|jgi:ABC-2 type transport system ATP-binding protein|nr:ABC transporter ATP-binding protein [Lachnospiraceae bacterium]